MTSRGGIGQRVRHLRSGLLASGGLLLLGLPAGALLRGGQGAAGVAAGVGLVAASYTLSSLVIAWADTIDPKLVLPVGLGAYVVKFTGIGLLMWLIAATGWAGLPAMGVALMAAVLAWVTAQAWWTYHAKILYVDV